MRVSILEFTCQLFSSNFSSGNPTSSVLFTRVPPICQIFPIKAFDQLAYFVICLSYARFFRQQRIQILKIRRIRIAMPMYGTRINRVIK